MKAVFTLILYCLLFVGGGYTQWKYGEPVIEDFIVEKIIVTTKIVEVPVIVVETTVLEVPVVIYETKIVEIDKHIIAWKEPKQCTID